MTEPLLAGRDLGHAVAGRAILSGVSVEIWPGERVALVGPSGSGKTTLLTLLSGLLRPSVGVVRFAGGDLISDPAQRRHIALVLQGYGLIGVLTAAENVEVALRATGRRPADAMEAAADVLGRLGLTRFADHLTDELSGGQRQRVAVARALALQPLVLLADEPTAEQDAEHEDLVLRHLLSPANRGSAVVVATHDADVAARCDRVIALADGRIAGADAGPGVLTA